MSAARHQDDVVAGLGQPSPYGAADGARSHDDVAHPGSVRCGRVSHMALKSYAGRRTCRGPPTGAGMMAEALQPYRDELRTLLGHVNPRHPLRSPLSVREVVLTGLTNSVEPVPRWSASAEQQEQADGLLKMLGMQGRTGSRWPSLSQGERGRTLIARALMPQPRLLLLDEPATGLDLAAREQLLDALDTLRQVHPELATVLVTHHLEELPASTTHAMLLRAGRCVASGPADDVLTTDQVSDCFGHPVRIARTDGRWTARAQRVTRG
ncbi:ABC transporter ATP-binding protein [Streptomyces sp. NPDC005146]